MSYPVYQVWAHDGNYSPGRPCDVTHIVIHNTGNTASAAAEASYAHDDQHSSSFHYVLDGGSIYQCVHEYDTAWSVGAWSGATQLISNGQSISIEVCSDGVPFTDAEISQCAWLVQDIMQRYGIPADNVVRHYDCHTGHKLCPAAYSGDNDGAWPGLWAALTSGATSEEEDDMQCIIQPNGESYMEWYDGTDVHALGNWDEVTAIDMVYQATHSGASIPIFALGTPEAPWASRFHQAIAADRGSFPSF